jgi:hypothetical protein
LNQLVWLELGTAEAMDISCPWPCVAKNPIVAPKTLQQQQRSFAQVLSPSTVVKSAPLPQTTNRGDNLSIKITENVYIMGLENCKHHMHDRLILNKGDKPYTAKEITTNLLQH